MKVLLLLVLLAQTMMGAPPQPMTPQEFARALPGQSVQVMVRVDHVRRSRLSATLLRYETGSPSKETQRRVELYFAGGTPVVMGSADDVVAGAVLFVYGIVTSANHLDAKRVVVVTKFVTVE